MFYKLYFVKMIKLMSLVMSMEIGQAASVTDVDGKSIEIEDELFTLYTLEESEFENTWMTMDDRVMGGGSYSYSQFDTYQGENVGLFNGTAVAENGGFSLISTTTGSKFTDLPVKWDLSEYDGLVIDVASKDKMTMKVLLTDDRWRWPSNFIYWEGMYETKGNFEQELIYIPFDNFYPTAYGFSSWPYRWIIPFKGLDESSINSIGYQYSIFEYISWFFFYIVPTDNYTPGYFEFHHKDIKAYKKIDGGWFS